VYCSAAQFRRAVKISLKWVGIRDRRRLAALLEAYRGAVNFFIRQLWKDPQASFCTGTSKRLVRTRLSARYRDQALKQAVETVAATRKSAKALGVTPRRPVFRGQAILDAKFAQVVLHPERSAEHDLVVRLSCLQKGKRLVLKSKRTRVLNRWLAFPTAQGVHGCALGDGDLLTIWVSFTAPAKRETGAVLGVDVGVTKLLATSEGAFLGRELRAVRDKVRRRRPGSRGRRRARRERDQLICAAVKGLPWERLRAVAFEDLGGIKCGKKPGRGRTFRRAMAAWRPPLVAQRLTCLAQEHGVLDVLVPPRGNSTTCLECGHRARGNRQGCVFRCLTCGFEADADTVGAIASARHGIRLLDGRLQAWTEQCAQDQAQRERRRAAAKRRGEAQAAKHRARRAAREEVTSAAKT
jgi:hypothetical protein